MAPLTGLEPATRCLEGSCSVQMSYRGRKRVTFYHTSPQPAMFHKSTPLSRTSARANK